VLLGKLTAGMGVAALGVAAVLSKPCNARPPQRVTYLRVADSVGHGEKCRSFALQASGASR